MTRLLGLAALGLAFAVTPALAQTACDQEARVVLDEDQPNEPANRLEANTRDNITVSRFRSVPSDNCDLGEQAGNMQFVQLQTLPEDGEQ